MPTLLRLPVCLVAFIVQFLPLKDHLRLFRVNKTLASIAKSRASWHTIEFVVAGMRWDANFHFIRLKDTRPRVLKLTTSYSGSRNSVCAFGSASLKVLETMFATVERMEIPVSVLFGLSNSVRNGPNKIQRIDLRWDLEAEADAETFERLVSHLKQWADQSLVGIGLSNFPAHAFIESPSWRTFVKLPVDRIGWGIWYCPLDSAAVMSALSHLPITQLTEMDWLTDKACRLMVSQFPQLTHLAGGVHGNLSDSGVVCLGGCPLARLELGNHSHSVHTAFTCKSLCFIRLSGLVTLRLENVHTATDEEVKQLFEQLVQLEDLSLVSCSALDRGIGFLASIENLLHLHWLPAVNPREYPRVLLRMHSVCTMIAYLGESIDHGQARELVKALPQLRELTFHRPVLDQVTAEALIQFARWPMLEQLWVRAEDKVAHLVSVCTQVDAFPKLTSTTITAYPERVHSQLTAEMMEQLYSRNRARATPMSFVIKKDLKFMRLL